MCKLKSVLFSLSLVVTALFCGAIHGMENEKIKVTEENEHILKRFKESASTYSTFRKLKTYDFINPSLVKQLKQFDYDDTNKQIKDITLLDTHNIIFLPVNHSTLKKSPITRLINARIIHEPIRPAEFYEKYGRNIALCIDEHGSELLSAADSNHIAVSHALSSLLKSKASIVLTTVDVWKKLRKVYNPEETLVNSCDWDIYINTFNMLIFIPKILQSQARVKNTIAGIDLTHFNPITIKQLFSLNTDQPSEAPQSGSLLTTLKNVVLPTSEDFNNRPWTIYAIGHGSTGTICGWPETTFNMFLDHLKTMKIKILVYSTCHGGSKQVLLDFYGSKVYPFPIAYPGLFDSVTTSHDTPNHEDFFRRLNSVASFKTTDNLDHIQYALQYIMHDSFKNTVRVRKAENDRFELVPNNHRVVKISELPKSSLFYSLSCAYLLDRPVFTDTLTFDRVTPIVTSALPGQVNHYMRHVRMPHVKDERHLFKCFMWAQSGDKRLYMIDVFEGFGTLKLENVMVLNNHEIPVGVNSPRKEGKHRLFFPKDSWVYSLSLENIDAPFQDRQGNEQDFRVYPVYSPDRYREFYTRTKAALMAHSKYRHEPAPLSDITIEDISSSSERFKSPSTLTAAAVNATRNASLVRRHSRI